ncbi:MAG: type II toxin-antitoxin system VapC family toxin [Bauldia sp.]|nr:MAG: type II toxin-antitoxin system VapC family toxin [Bauldia sp.]MBZ0228543.1 type II toxin-antitoxin system VapC family toxin [Bauldia sp.]
MSEIVLDASVVLAAILEEPGHEVMLELRDAALMSAVNLAEARTRLIDHGYDRQSIDTSIGLLNIKVIDFDTELAVMSAELRPATRAAGLSLGDRACLALALKLGAVALTADRAWAGIETAVEVRVVR